MSSVYVLEPPTKGKVVLTTSMGDIDIELWPTEAPKAVRNFVQLCLEGYYDNTPFHRIIKGFMVQGGDPTGTGTGGESIYGAPFPDEFHSRLKFNHRGLVACANAGSPHSNSSQFFFTLDKCEWLDKQNTIFGKITGDTIYNALKMGEVDTDENDRPDDPPTLISVEVLWNPFEDIVPRTTSSAAGATVGSHGVAQGEAGGVPVQKKPKEKRRMNLLSFADDEEQLEMLDTGPKRKIQSSHDVLDDPRLLREGRSELDDMLKGNGSRSAIEENEISRREEARLAVHKSLQRAAEKKSAADRAEKPSLVSKKQGDPEDEASDEEEADFDARMRRQVYEKKMQLLPGDEKQDGKNRSSKRMHGKAVEDAAGFAKRKQERLVGSGDSDEELMDQEPQPVTKAKVTAVSFKGSAVSGEAQLLTPLEQRRQQFKEKKRLLGSREKDTLERLAKFKSVLKGATDPIQQRVQSEKAPEKSREADFSDDESNWMKHKLKFVVDPLKKDDMSRGDDPNQYVVHDPLLEKGKEKFNKMQAKVKKRGREWAGKSLD